MEIIPCDFCGSSDRHTLFDNSDFPWLDQNLGIALVVCKQCGLVYLCPRPDKSEIQEHYPDDYPSYSKLLDDEKSFIIKWARKRNLSIRREFIEKFINQPNKKILDVGCSTGLFLEEMRSNGWEVLGIEPNTSAAKIARERLGLNVHKGYLETFDFPSATFDVITYWDVLEHTYSPKAELKAAYSLLKPEGKLIINIPNFDAFDRKLLGPAWQGYDPPRHLFVFPPEILTQYLGEAGLEIIEWRCLISSYYSVVMGMEKLLDSTRPKCTRHIMNILHFPGIRYVFEPILTLIQKFSRGSIITVVAEKKF